jgi:hypothetical protein
MNRCTNYIYIYIHIYIYIRVCVCVFDRHISLILLKPGGKYMSHLLQLSTNTDFEFMGFVMIPAVNSRLFPYTALTG